MATRSLGLTLKGLSSFLLLFVLSHQFKLVAADGTDVIFAFTDTSGEEPTIFKWAYNSSDAQQPEPFVTMQGSSVITEISCSFWGSNQDMFFITHDKETEDWTIRKAAKNIEGTSSVVLDQNIGVFGIAKLTYDATLNRLYFVNHFVSHWSLEMLDLILDKRIVLQSGYDGTSQCHALHYQNGYLFWLQDDMELHYTLSDGSGMKLEPLSDEGTAVDITGYGASIYIAYEGLVEKRQLENNKWTAKERMSILGANVTSIYATDKLLYVARNDGITEKIDLETWQKLEAERLTSSSIVFAGICVDTDAETDPSEYTSVCSGNTDCDEFCFDVNDQVVCYCEHESKQVNISENCPEAEMHVAISSGDRIKVIKGVHGTIESLMNVDIETNETSTLSIESLSYSNKQDKIYAALGKTVKTLKVSTEEVLDSVELSYKILRLRIDDAERRVYVAGDNGHIEYYDLSLPKDEVLDSKHLVISRIYATDFVVDYCYKNLYIASMNPVKIVKSSLDGGNFETIVDVFKVGHITALALDRTASRFLYLFDSGKQEVAKVDLKDAAYNHEVIHKFDYEVEINSMDLRDNYLYFINPVKDAVQRIDVTVPGSLLNMQDLHTEQDTHRLVALEPVQCPHVGPCHVYNGGCMDVCHVAEKRSEKTPICECTHENQHLVTTVSGFCDWSNKTIWCEGYVGSQSDLSCDYGMRCLGTNQVCDGKRDCQDGSDENPGICASATCADGQFKCHNGQCIESNLECNHNKDCHDESDELDCDYNNQQCGEDEFQCPGNFKCIPNAWKCDHEDDCLDGMASDETYGEPANCPDVDCASLYSFWAIFLNYVPCNNTGICIPSYVICNGIDNCGSNTDEENCDSHDCGEGFKCKNGRCVIFDEWVCDSYDDCGDLSDEDPSFCANLTCGEEEFTCANGNCIPNAYRCDSDNDCEDNSDEEPPLVDCANLQCEANQIRCNNTDQSRQRCIDRSEVCDHKSDCQDGEDELGCSSRPVCSSDTQFTCKNQLCIPQEWFCDHDNDCGDGSDEPSNECSYRDCTSSEFRCNNGKCIPMFYHCDRMNDCLDQSDEQDCNYDVTVTCATDEVECPGMGSGQCIKKSAVCNGVNDCDHGSDEVNCGINECEIDTLNSCEYECVDEESGYSCTCPPGYEADTDNGHSCVDINECDQYFKKCTHTCENLEGGFACFCELGYILEKDENGNATICKHADANPVYLLISDELSARLYDLHTRETEYVENEGDLIAAADFDYDTEKVIYVDVTKKHIASISKNGTNRKVLINRDVPGGEGLAVDWIGRNFYWLDNERLTLEVATLDGKHRKILSSKYLKEPRAIVVHPRRKMLFYTDWGYGNQHIGRMYMDGREQKKIVTSRVSWPNALTIDYATEILFYADAHLNVIETFDMNGENRRVLMSSSASAAVMSHVFAMTVFDEFMYWTDWNLGTVTRADNRNGEKAEVIYQASKRPMDVHIWHRLRQSPNEVLDATGNKLPTYLESGCWLMLLTDNGGSDYVCDCPDNFVIGDDGKTCETNCPLGYKICDDESSCYRSERYCDGFKDCFDGSDEPDTCPPNPCAPGQLHCLGSNKCVEHSQICDGSEQCKDTDSDEPEARSDITDEEDCETFDCPRGHFKCENHKCIKDSLKCNSVNDCFDNSDEDEELCGQRECDPHVEFTCKSGLCIPLPWECDVDHDCPDGDDEPSDCATRVADCKASDGKFSCHSNYRCIPNYLKCNGNDDCRDNSDEENCESKTCETGYFRCDNGRECIPERWKCDFYQNCADGSDESEETCADSYRECDSDVEFRCDNQKCVSLRDVCDTIDDCGDNSDETKTDCGDLQCHSDQFQCTTSGHCIPLYKRCHDGTADCPDKSDEEHCGPRYPDGSYCLDNQFECDNKVCIAQNEVCNTFDDCGDGSDEIHSEDRCNHANCDAENVFPCNSGECVYKFHICNGIEDCSDGSDETEQRCRHTCQIEGNNMSCHNGYQCFTETQACDTFNNCDDRTDELGCSATSCDNGNGGCEQYCNTTTSSSGETTTFCSCQKGFEHDPDDAHKCIVKDYCKDWSTCSQTCMSSREGFTCVCSENYKLSADGKVCKALGDPPVQLYVKGDIIMRLVTHPMYFVDAETMENVGDPISMDFFIEPDNSLNLLLWLNQRSNSIHRSIIPGLSYTSTVEQSDKIELKNGRKPDRAITVDWIHNLLYFFEKDSNDKKLFNFVVCTVDGRYPKTLLHKAFEDPRDVVVDPINGWLFIADVKTGVEGGGHIYKYKGMGLNLETIVYDSIGGPHGLAIDFFKDSRLYWSDSSQRLISSVKPDGSERHDLYLSRFKPGALVVFEHEIYFYAEELDVSESPATTGIYKRNKFLDKEAEPDNVKSTDYNTPYILFHAYARPVGLNRCGENECSHLCLPIFQAESANAHVCACPDGDSGGDKPTCSYATEEWRAFEPCSGRGDIDENLKCVCHEGYEGPVCQKSEDDTPAKNKKTVVVVATTLAIFSVVFVIILLAVFSPIPLKDKLKSRLFGPKGNDRVSFHVGSARANPGFDTLDNDRVTLGRDFPGFVDEDAMKKGEAPRVDFAFGQGGTSVAFSNPVFDIQLAQTALQDFQPPGQTTYEENPSAPNGNFPKEAVMSSSDVKVELEADKANKL